MLIDFAIYFGLAGLIWLVLHHSDRKGLALWVMAAVGVAYLTPRVIGALFLWASYGVANWPIWVPSFHGLVELAAIAAVAALMWRIAYRRKRTTVDAEIFN
jgi:hypothetical protein